MLALDLCRGSRLVAVKLVPGAVAGDPGTARLEDEFLVLTGLAHPNIARVRDFGRLEGGGVYYTSDYVNGGNLLAWASELEPPVRWALLAGLAAEALSVLGYLSLRGIGHGDVKPSNLLVERAPAGDDECASRRGAQRLKVIDFGTARLASDATGSAQGTRAYLPPPALLGSLPDAEGRSRASDLWGLGLAIFHAGIGRLPFALGDPASLLDWWRRGGDARPSRFDADVPPAMDALVGRLTSVDGSARFRTAAEALEFLGRRIKLPPQTRSASVEETWTAGRERRVAALLRTVLGPGGRRRIHAVVGPSGDGKTRFLEVLSARLQVEGFRVLFFSSPSDSGPLSELESLAERSVPREGSGSADLPDVVARLGARSVAVVIDDDRSAPERPGPVPFLREWLASRAGGRGGGSAAVTVVAGTDPESICAELGLRRTDLEVHPLETLRPECIAELVREHFSVETVPASLTRRLELETGGLPARVLEALRTLAASGAARDASGTLRVPSVLPDRLVGDRPPGAADFDPVERRALGLLRIAGEPIDPEGCAARFPGWDTETWLRVLEGLRSRGLVRCELGAEGLRYRLTGGGLQPELGGLLRRDEEREARASLATWFAAADARRRPRPDTLLAAARNQLALCGPSAARRLASRAARALARESREADARDILAAALGGSRPASGGEARRRLALRVRLAELLLQAGKAAEALELLEVPPSGSPPWYSVRARKLRARARDLLEDVESAIAELEHVGGAAAGRDDRRDETPADSLLRLESAALLAPLLFRSGRSKDGRSRLGAGSDLLRPECASVLESDRPRAARLLVQFARTESTHGDAEVAGRLLERALRLAEGLLRDEISWGALNELGILQARSRRLDEALRTFEEVERRAMSLGRTLGAVKAIYNRAVIHYRRQQLEQADKLFLEATSLSDSVGFHSLTAPLWIGHAGVLRERGKSLEALRLYRRVLRLGPRAALADQTVAHNNLAELYLALGSLRRAALHADLAFRSARGSGDRFRIVLTLRLRGLVRWALGRRRDARSDLQRVLGLAAAEGDLRSQGIARQYLGTIARTEGDMRTALKLFRAGMADSRRAGDTKHLLSGRIAALACLLCLGRRRAARRLLRTDGGSGPSGRRERILALRSGDGWPRDAGAAVAIAREAAEHGQPWEAFCELRWLRDDPRIDESMRRTIAIEAAWLSQRFVRALSERSAARFRDAWDLGASSPDPGSTGGGAAPTPPSPGRDRIAAMLETASRRLALRAAWIWEDPGVEPRLDIVVPSVQVRLPRLLARHAAAFDRVRSGGAMAWDRPLLLARVGRPEKARILCLEADARRWDRLKAAPGRLEDHIAGISLAVQLFDSEEELSTERARHAEARAEIHRLHASALEGRRELETAIASQGVELVDMRLRVAAGARSGSPYRTLVADSPRMRRLVTSLPLLADKEIPVLLVGESGVGKDLLARALHDLSRRQSRPFVAEICNVPESLMETELFGFAKGAFSGAVRDRPGMFQRVRGGTIYLDEISDLSPSLQARLLRVLEEKRVRPVGAESSLEVDFRLVSSSRHALRDLVDPSVLRKDLLYRINAEVLEIPPLRDRIDDLPRLVRTIVEEGSRRLGIPTPNLHDATIEKLSAHRWPGNVRELENVLERVLVTRPVEIAPEDLGPLGAPAPAVGPPAAPPSRRAIPKYRTARDRWERDLLLEALRLHSGNATRAARALGLTRRYLGTLLRKHAVDLEDMRGGAESPKRSRRRDRRSQPSAGRPKGGGPKRPEKEG